MSSSKLGPSIQLEMGLKAFRGERGSGTWKSTHAGPKRWFSYGISRSARESPSALTDFWGFCASFPFQCRSSNCMAIAERACQNASMLKTSKTIQPCHHLVGAWIACSQLDGMHHSDWQCAGLHGVRADMRQRFQVSQQDCSSQIYGFLHSLWLCHVKSAILDGLQVT